MPKIASVFSIKSYGLYTAWDRGSKEGDTIWEPADDKRGIWMLVVSYKGKEVARKCFNIF